MTGAKKIRKKNNLASPDPFGKKSPKYILVFLVRIYSWLLHRKKYSKKFWATSVIFKKYPKYVSSLPSRQKLPLSGHPGYTHSPSMEPV
jgi:hypothetical protein